MTMTSKIETKAEQVCRRLGGGTDCVGDAFYGGGGEEMYAAFMEAGWTTDEFEAPYLWTVEAPDGSSLRYVEGDLFIGRDSDDEDRPDA